MAFLIRLLAASVILESFVMQRVNEERVLQLSGSKSFCNYTGFVTEDSLPSLNSDDPCQECWCQNSATVCKRLKCQKVECNYEAGESLTLEPNDCCPSCSGSQIGCHHQGHVARHNEVWQPDKCQTCYCRNGQVFCKQDICQEKVCPIGYSLHTKRDLCCPTCTRDGRNGPSCTHAGISYSDGDSWPSTSCSLCHCHRGIVQCYVEECASMTCNQNETAVTLSGECCPVCIGFPCTHDNKEHQSGDTWNPNPCEHCSCHNGKIVCVIEVCGSQQCAKTEHLHQFPNECCPSCVPKNSFCHYGNETHFDGEMWKINACEFCICENGKSICHTATCNLLICHEGELLVHKLGKCCAECSPRSICLDKEGVSHDDGDVWKTSPCQLCRCSHGKIRCYTTICAGCPRHFVSVSVEGLCCPICRKIRCRPDCKKCDPYHPEQCLSCINERFVQQDGRCLARCGKGHFTNSQRVCLRCHHTCVSCSGPSQHHCTNCLSKHMLFNGWCISHCPERYYRHKNTCLECHHSCLNCFGPGDNHCTSCSVFEHHLQLNQCVEKCELNFYAKHNGYCEACDAACRTCAFDSYQCTSCHPGEYLQETKCVEVCDVDFYPTADGVCSPCHSLCAACRGPTALQCTRCHSEHVLLDGQCLADNCDDGYYNHNGICEACHPSCRLCVGPTENHCLSCSRPEESLVRVAYQKDGFCTDVCPIGFYRSQQNICDVCDDTCFACNSAGPTSCTSCPEQLILREGQCVADCGNNFFREGNLCLACHPGCDTCYGKKAQNCASCRSGEYLLMSGMCSSECASGQYMDRHRICHSCDHSCKECTLHPQGSGSVCGECKNTRYYLQQHECVPACRSGYFLDEGRCKACHESCATCDRDGIIGCTSCHGTKVLSHLSTCTTKCYDGYYASSGVCYICASNCLHCSSDGQCKKCRNPTMVVAFGECVSHCPDQYFPNKQGLCTECAWTCNACHGPASTDCLSCMPGALLQNGSCVKECSAGYYRIGAVCRACNRLCKTCFGPGLSCTSCRAPELLLDGSCSLGCGFQKFANTTTYICEDCPENCVQCSSRTQCEVCLKGYILKKSRCYRFCGDGMCTNYKLCEGNIFTLFPTAYQIIVHVNSWASFEDLVLSVSNYYDATRLWLMNYPANGIVVSVSNGSYHTLQKGSSFTLSQLRRGDVGIIHKIGLSLRGTIQFGTSLEGSCPIYSIPIRVVSLHSPEVLTNQPLVLGQGQYKAFSSNVLDIEDLDNENDVVIKIIEGPIHGSLVDVANHQTNISSFHIKDLLQESVVYVHHNLEGKEDFVILQITDGYHTKNIVFAIHIIPKRLAGPVLVHNSGVLVPFGGSVVISKESLQVVDSRSPESDIYFNLLPKHHNLRKGRLLLKAGNHRSLQPQVNASNKHIHSMEEVVVNEFKQSDINEGKLVYQHTSENVKTEDYLFFEVKDSASPANVLKNQTFIIRIDVKNDGAFTSNPISELSLHSSLKMEVFGNELVPLTNGHLLYSGHRVKPEDIVYTIAQELSVDQGSFEHVDRVGVPIFTFTQSDVNELKLLYRPSPMAGEHSRTFQIEFSVSARIDQQRITLASQFLHISISNLNNLHKPSFLLDYPVFVVPQGGSIPIPLSYFSVEDDDTGLTDLLFTITKETKFGSVVHVSRGEEIFMKNGTDFTYDDIVESSITYINDGASENDDEFVVTVTDGQFNDSLHLYFILDTNEDENSLSDETTISHLTSESQKSEENKVLSHAHLPEVESNNKKVPNKYKKSTLFRFPAPITAKALQLSQDEAGMVFGYILMENLATGQQDILPHQLVYNVSAMPQHGYLEHISNPGVQVLIFTQADVNLKHLRYILKSRQVDVATDQFSFVANSKETDIAFTGTLMIVWSWITFSEDHFTVRETDGVIRIKLRRHGQLKQRAVIRCETEDGSALSQIPGQEDFISHTGQVHFDSGEEEEECIIVITDNSKFEGPETFYVKLADPINGLVGETDMAVIVITDSEDEPTLAFSQHRYYTKEEEESFSATIVRTGDLSSTISAVCYTLPQTATSGAASLLGVDFLSRRHGEESRVTLKSGVSKESCDVMLVDDSEYEGSEEFQIILADCSEHCRIANVSLATVVIEGPNDGVTVQFVSMSYIFEEKPMNAKIELVRYGPDLTKPTTVWCSTAVSDPPSALPSVDFVPTSKQVFFEPEQTKASCSVSLLDDDSDPQVEGNETFILKLSSAVGGAIGDPSLAVITIMDTTSDVPYLTFGQSEIEVLETSQTFEIPIIRKGDVRSKSSVRCFTRQKTAHAGKDFQERPNTDASRITFYPGEKQKNCIVTLIDDVIFEPVEQFILKLKDIRGPSGGILGLETLKIFITNEEDVPIVQLEKSVYSILEPSAFDKSSAVSINIIRQGDISNSCSVWVSTHDGSAIAGTDYHASSQKVHFDAGEGTKTFEVIILYNVKREPDANFIVLLSRDEAVNVEIGKISFATITILDIDSSGSQIMPVAPIVVSLMDYDNIKHALSAVLSPGYPLVCITSCDPHFPNFSITGPMCHDAGINQSSIFYSWEVSTPTESNTEIMPSFTLISQSNGFASNHHMVLDSSYFRPKYQVRCAASPLQYDGSFGVAMRSSPVTIGNDNGICYTPAEAGGLHEFRRQSFVTSLEYLQPKDKNHPNRLHVHVEVPHQDGMLPVLSTFPLHNLEFLLSQPLYQEKHMCSNFITSLRGNNSKSFLYWPAGASQPWPSGDVRPYQFNETVREVQSLLLYRHLNLKRCLWSFDAYFHMTELVDVCGGNIFSNFQMRNTSQTFVTVKLPLYVTYVYAAAPIGWTFVDHRTELEFSFYYENILWHTGINTDNVISAKIQIVRVATGKEGQLNIDFRTEAHFRGQFVLDHESFPNIRSRVLPPDASGTEFNLDLIWSPATFDGPTQLWRASSKYSLKDYSGKYVFELIPCTVQVGRLYTVQKDVGQLCTAHLPQRYEIPIAYQQIHRPVPVVYTLNTSFHLLNNEQLFLSNPIFLKDGSGMDYTGTFSKGQSVYGRVMWNPSQNLDAAYKLEIEKVYVCAGRDGYQPTYDPTGSIYGDGIHFGCIYPHKDLRFRILLLDRYAAGNEQQEVKRMQFDAKFASDHINHSTLVKYSGVDGFSFKVDSLYNMHSGQQWFLQVIYHIQASRSGRRFHRSANLDVLRILNQDKRASNGTNMKPFYLDPGGLPYPDTNDHSTNSFSVLAVVVVGVVVIFLVLSTSVVLFFCWRRKQGDKEVNAFNTNIQDNKSNLYKTAQQRHNRHLEKAKRKRHLKEMPLALNSNITHISVKVKPLSMTVHNNLSDNNLTEV